MYCKQKQNKIKLCVYVCSGVPTWNFDKHKKFKSYTIRIKSYPIV